MEAVLRNFGNSVGLVLPLPVRKAMGLKAGQTMYLEASANGLLMRPAGRKYQLGDLLAQCNPRAPMPKDVLAWQEAPAVGREAW